MKKRKLVLTGLILAMTASALLSGCKKKTAETETETQTEAAKVQKETETERQTETQKKASKVTFKAKDGSLSIKLPDDTWKNTEEKDDQWKFESTDAGTITIVHYTGTDMQGLTFPASEEEVLQNLESAGKSKNDYAVVQYKKDTLGTYDAYHTTIKCKKTDATYAYSVAYNLVGSDDIYSVNGQVKEDDATAMETIRTAVESLKLINNAGTSSSEKKETEETKNTTEQSETTSTTTNGQYLYDSNGNSIYIYQDSNGYYVDNYGNTYTMTETGAVSSGGVSYTYNQPSSSDSGSTSQSESTSFYDTYGNQIMVYKDSNGNWVDTNGIVYSFGQYGVTDNYGNYYPYDGSSTTVDEGSESGSGSGSGETTSNTNGFYDDQGNWISVYQDSNGNWIDNGGMEYTFGDSGVTDSYGNYYPY